MSLRVSSELMAEIGRHGEEQYPEEAAGLLLGAVDGETRSARRVLPLANVFDSEQRGRRYLINPLDILHAEDEAERLGMDVVGVFHSHPDHPPTPSKFDLDWAVPWYVYLITSVREGIASESRAWKLQDDHSQMIEELLTVEQEAR